MNRYEEARKEHNYNRTKASEGLGIGTRELRLYETGAKEPGVFMLKRMAAHYGHSIDWLVGRDVAE